ncbi:unnamed protein product [Nippostrongylus brasiliensis]|uniref:Uncharacterized protein n=1 Tax=Nippostrongylus brasiliensis TaxID=27835 RepID=A0A0N4XV47_NIPBR|nr:unnamed protein product [Nippostrongylus brasiliensis]
MRRRRSLPVPISGSSSNGFYVGTVRDPRRYSLGAMIRAIEKKSHSVRVRRKLPSLSLSNNNNSTAEKAVKEDLEDVEKENYCDPEFTTFFFDEEMHLWANEIANPDRRYNIMPYEKLASPIMEDEPIRNYEDLVPGRHRRSGNERVHPNNLYTAFSRQRRRLERDLPAWIDMDSSGKNEELKYWQDRINSVYQNFAKPLLNRDRALRNTNRSTITTEGFQSENELDSSGSAPLHEICDIGSEIFGFSDVDSDIDS